MKKELAALLARAEVDEIEASHKAISRLLKLVAEAKHDAVDETAEARAAVFTLLRSSRLAVVSLTCQGQCGGRYQVHSRFATVECCWCSQCLYMPGAAGYGWCANIIGISSSAVGEEISF